MYSKEIREKVVLEFLQSGLSYKSFWEKNYSNLNCKTIYRWVNEYKMRNHLPKKSINLGNKSFKESINLKDEENKEPVSMFCYDVDVIKTTEPAVPTQVKQNSIFNITDKIQFQSDILNTYKDLTDVKYSDSNVILLKKIRGLCDEFTI